MRLIITLPRHQFLIHRRLRLKLRLLQCRPQRPYLLRMLLQRLSALTLNQIQLNIHPLVLHHVPHPSLHLKVTLPKRLLILVQFFQFIIKKIER